MYQKKDASNGVIKLEPCKWLRGVEKLGLLNLLWMSHYHHAPMTIFFIRQLLCLVHDGYLWLEDPIPITIDLIHHISRLPYKGKDLARIVNSPTLTEKIIERCEVHFALGHKGCKTDTRHQNLLGAHGDEHLDVDLSEATLVTYNVQ